MNQDKYKVEILHYTNPHLLWALVPKEDEKKYYLEQIGIYGIVPLEVKIEDGNVETKISKEWSPPVYVAMKKLLLDAAEVWFSVTFWDRTTSIFDDKIHKYGDLTIKLKNGETVSMLQRLLDIGFVAEDVAFHKNLQTKLDYQTTISVFKRIKENIKTLKVPTNLINVLNSQTTVYRNSVKMEQMSPQKLDLELQDNAYIGLRKQINHLNLCQDVDDEEKSAGRAYISSKSIKRTNAGLMQKLEMIMKTSVSDTSTDKDDKRETEDINQDGREALYVEQEKLKKYAKKGKKPKTMLMAFGPPGINPTQYCVKEVNIEKDNALDDNKAEDENETFSEKADSEISVKSKYLDIIKMKTKFKNNTNYSPSVIMKEETYERTTSDVEKKSNTDLHRKMKMLREKMVKTTDDSSSSRKIDSSARQGDDSDTESILSLVNKLDVSENIKKEFPIEPEFIDRKQNNVNPFKNMDGSRSVFVEKMVTPTVMVHTKHGNRIQPVMALRDVPFGTNIHIVLRNMSVQKPMRPQAVSWPIILRGHSLFLVSPCDSGKTIGYLPAVCRLVSDNKKITENISVVRLTCIIVCATSKSVSHIQQLCNMFLHEARVFACYTGMTDMFITTSILNGCDILICTPTMLVRLMRENLGLDLRNLTTFVIDDCERIAEVYQNEIKFCVFKVKEMMKSRANKELKVQYIVTSRIWCEFMSSLAKKAPDSVVCIAAFQECVLYSEVDTSVEFLKTEDKIDSMLNFLKDIDKSKKTVIACRFDDEVHLIKKRLTDLGYVVFACDSTMTIQDLYSIDLALTEYQEPLIGPILVCCDANLTQLNITDAHNLIHFSLPELFSLFCRRFAVLIDNYPSIFKKEEDNSIKIKILLENSNIEQLPKILNFIKRCSDNVPTVLEEISAKVMKEKDLKKAENFVPLCGSLLSLGKCPDIWNCMHRHSLFEKYDEPKTWMPRKGTVTFKILHYHSAVRYSAKMISCTNSDVSKYPQTHASLSIKLGLYYSKENNLKLHGIAKPGDICAVSLKQTLFARCQVLKVLKYQNNVPSVLLINLLDEEKYEMVRDTCLYHLPEELKSIKTYVAQVILANIAPVDKDITYSDLALNQLKRITEENPDFYMRGRISMVIGNCIFVDTLEACKDLSVLNETVVKNNFKDELLDGHAVVNSAHLTALEKLGEGLDFVRRNEVAHTRAEVPKPIKVLPKARWAHLESNDHAPVYYMYAKNPGLFFVQHVKFQDCLKHLLKDIKKYVADNPEPVEDVKEGDIVLAEFPDDASYERARVDNVIDESKVICFYVDLGDWSVVSRDKLLTITEKLITQLPFQAIECRLVGVKPVGSKWSEFSTNWLVDQCYGSTGELKYLYAKRFTKEKAEFTEGSRYGIGLIDTYKDDVYINKMMIDANLAEENDEIDLLGTINIEDNLKSSSDTDTSQAKIVIPKEKGKVKSSDVEKINGTTASLNVNNSIDDSNSNDDASDISTEKSINVLDSKNISLITDDENISNVETGSNTEVSDDNEFAQADRLAKIEKRIAVNQRKTSQNASNKDKRKAMLALLNSYSKSKDNSRTNSVLSEGNSTKSSEDLNSAIDETVKEEVKISKQDDLKATEDNQLAVCDAQQSTRMNDELESNFNLNTGMATEDGHRANQKAVMQLLRSNPIRSVPLVEDDDIDDDRWDMGQNTLMLLGPMLGLNLPQTEFDEQKPAPILKAIEGKSESTTTSIDKPNIVLTTKPVSSESNNIAAPSTKETNSQVNTTTDKPEFNGGDNLRKPKIVWRQYKDKVIAKIQLITDKYDMVINEKHLKLYAEANGKEYGFEIELYGVIDVEESSHANKGQYIQVNLQKLMAKSWLTLSKGIKKWIVYDVDNIDISSEDESDSAEDISNLQKNLNINLESDSDEDFDDDTNMGYKKHY